MRISSSNFTVKKNPTIKITKIFVDKNLRLCQKFTLICIKMIIRWFPGIFIISQADNKFKFYFFLVTDAPLTTPSTTTSLPTTVSTEAPHTTATEPPPTPPTTPTIPTIPTTTKTTTVTPDITTTVDPITTTTVDPKTTTTISPDPKTTTTVSPDPITTTTTLSPDPKTTTTETPITTTIQPNSTIVPPTTTEPPPTPKPIPPPCRRFDGPSFIGGIVLAVGLMAISIVAWKFYKARTDRNYHTL